MEGDGYSLWPTPSASDGLRAKFSLEICRKTLARKQHDGWATSPAQGNLSERLAGELGLLLRPEFSEWMMGFPIDWTNLDCAESGTPSCQTSPK